MASLGVSIDILLSPVFLVGAVVAVAAVLLGTPRLAVRYATSRLVAALAVLSVAAILLLTAPVVRPGALLHLDELWSTTRALTWTTQGLTELRLVDLGVEGWANVLLYLPAGALWASMTGRRWSVVAAFTGASFGIETLQAGLLLRVADPRDLYANAVGTVVGVLCAVVLARSRSSADRSPLAWVSWTPRRAGASVLALALLGVLLAGAHSLLDTLADRDRDRLLASVRSAYGATTSRDVLDAAARDRYSAFASRAGVHADYLGVVAPDVVQARFSTDSTARPRCVLVTWTGTAAPSFAPDSGPSCSVFREAGLPSPPDRGATAAGPGG